MDRIKGLKEYIREPEYRKALGLPREVIEEYSLLAQGEYNINYLFEHPVTKRKLLLRVNCGSQMHLDNQIEYEAAALEYLKVSGRTPEVYYVDGSKEFLDHGILVEDYLKGRVLDYKRDLKKAARILADIHSTKIPGENHLIKPDNPLQAILEECEDMFSVYMASDLGDREKKVQIRRMLDKGFESLKNTNLKDGYQCLINTELNSTNFLINGDGKDYLIDWEKPVYGDPAQDIAHFLAPTTTFWKTDVILSSEEVEEFIGEYIEAVKGRFPVEGLRERVYTYIPITCLRGITWCAMAWIQYQQPDKMIFNESTFRKLEAYLANDFLGDIENEKYK